MRPKKQGCGQMIKEPVAKYIVNSKGKRTGVILDMKTYEEILDLLDDYYCTKAYDEAKPIVEAEIARGEYETLDDFLASRKTKPE
jgi:hypothetical protein